MTVGLFLHETRLAGHKKRPAFRITVKTGKGTFLSDKVKVVLVMGAAVFLAAFGEALAAKGMKVAGEQSGLMAQIAAAVRDWHVLLGAALMAGYVALYIYALGLTELSFALPLSASSYLLGLALSKYYLHEDIKPARLIGTLIIIAGVIVVGIGGASDGGGGSGSGEGGDKK